MDMQQAVLKLFLCNAIDDPAEECAAFRLEWDPSETSSFWQLVKEPGKRSHSRQKIHRVVSLSDADETEAALKQQYHYVTRVGTTYCVAPYTLGFARVGMEDAHYGDLMGDAICDAKHFPLYLRNWLHMEEGYAQLLDFIAKDEDDYTVSDLAEMLAEEPGYIDYAQNDYISAMYHAKEKSEASAFMKERLEEFKATIQPLTKPQLNDKLSQYFMIETDADEKEMLHKGIQDYFSAGLMWNINLRDKHERYSY